MSLLCHLVRRAGGILLAGVQEMLRNDEKLKLLK